MTAEGSASTSPDSFGAGPYRPRYVVGMNGTGWMAASTLAQLADMVNVPVNQTLLHRGRSELPSCSRCLLSRRLGWLLHDPASGPLMT